MRRLRNTKARRAGAACLAAAMILALTGCGSADKSAPLSLQSGYSMNSAVMKDSAMSEAATEMDMGIYESESVESTSASVGESAAAADSQRKLIKTVNMTVETKEYDTLMSTLTDRVETLGGYIERMDAYNGSSYSNYRSARNASLTIRIPKDKLDSFLETVSSVGNVISRSDNVEDVTLTYVDLESHKEALEVEQERLLTYLEQAETLEDMITLESRLSSVRYQLESMESQLRTFDNQVDYSTVYINIEEVKELTPVPVDEPTRWERLTEGFVESLKDVGNGILDFLIWIVVHLPYFAVWAVVIIGIILIVKGIRKHSKKKKAKKLEMMQKQQAQQQNQQQQ